jgi:cytochrome c oxidase subunit 2
VQKYWSLVFGVTMLLAFVLTAVSPLMGWWLPRDVSTYGAGIDRLFYLILGVTAFFFVLTEAIMAYALWKFAYRPGHKASYTHGNHRLEVVWTLVPGVILFLLALWQIDVWADVKYQSRMPTPEKAALQMEVQARQWEWRVRYPSVERFLSWQSSPESARDFGPNPHEDDVRVVNEIHIWKGSHEQPAKVLVHLKTQDILHSFFLPNLRIKQDAVPGKTIPVWFAAVESNAVAVPDPAANRTRWVEEGYDRKTGRAERPELVWELACAEFCGARHAMMRGKLYVHPDRDDFVNWLRQAQAENRRTQPAGPTTASR